MSTTLRRMDRCGAAADAVLERIWCDWPQQTVAKAESAFAACDSCFTYALLLNGLCSACSQAPRQMAAHNVNRHLEATTPSFWDSEPVATGPVIEVPWPEMGQLDLFCSGCAGRTWSHDCWEGGISA